MKHNALYIQSGGPTAVINASACGVIRACRENREAIGTLYASLHGIHGMLEDRLMDLTGFTQPKLEQLRCTPGMAFGSSRYVVDENPDADDYKLICNTLREHEIRYILMNGGNGSARAGLRLSNALAREKLDCNLIVIPKTVDNDLLGTDHAPGYPSAARHVALTVAELTRDLATFDTELIMIVEVMGRNTGFLAAASLAAGTVGRAPDLIYVPETPFDTDQFVEDIRSTLSRTGKCLAVVSEGIKNRDGKYLFEDVSLNSELDPSRNMGGVAYALGQMLRSRFTCKIRCIDLNLMQRCSAHDAAELDRNEAEKLGYAAVEMALRGNTNRLVSLRRVGDQPYRAELQLLDLAEMTVDDQVLPERYITRGGVTPAFLEYLMPIIGPLPAFLPPIPQLG